jgi:hypothetical protein
MTVKRLTKFLKNERGYMNEVYELFTFAIVGAFFFTF